MPSPKPPSKTPQKIAAGGPYGIQAPRMRAPLRQAIDEIVFKGRTQRKAAEIVGYNETSLGRALQRPDIAAWVEHLKTQALQDANKLSKQARAIALQRGMELLNESKDERIVARMVEFFGREAGQPLVNINLNSQPQSAYTFIKPDDLDASPDTASGVLDAQPIDNAEQSDEV